MHLNALEYGPNNENEDDPDKPPLDVTCVKTPLEMITAYRDESLIMHPIIQKALDIKWKLFGRKVAIRGLISTVFLAICWLVLAYLLEDDSAKLYAESTRWKISFEVLIVLFSFYFFISDLLQIIHELKTHSRWKHAKIREINSQYIYCHPSWFNERESLQREKEFIKSMPNLNEYFWFGFECFQLVLLCAAAATRVLVVLDTSSWLFLILHKIVIGINTLYASFRIIKSMIKFKYLASCLTVMADSLTSIFQICFFYLQIYIPFVAAFWLMFGNPRSETLTTRSVNNTNLPRLFYEVFTLSFEQNDIFRFEKQDFRVAEIFISLFHVFATFIALSIIITFIQVKFKDAAIRNVARASLSFSNFLLSYEKRLGEKERRKLRLYYMKHCDPLTVNEPLVFDQLRTAQARSKIKNMQTRLTEVYEVIRLHEKYSKTLIDREEHSRRTVYNELLNRIENSAEGEGSLRRLLKDFNMMSMKHEYLNGMIKKSIGQDG